jgi:mannose-6-phosphate isomerase-like protein (cupin superfamily)
MTNPALPFIFHEDFVRKQQSGIANWHDNTEFLFCIDGEGIVNCDSHFIEMKKGDTIVINARCLHTISSATKVRYHCLIIDNSFFKDLDLIDVSLSEV